MAGRSEKDQVFKIILSSRKTILDYTKPCLKIRNQLKKKSVK